MAQTPIEKKLAKFYERLKQLYHLGGAAHLLGWDQRVCMPLGGAEARADQLAFISELLHKLATEKRFVTLVEELSHESLSEVDTVNVREIKRDVSRVLKLPRSFVSARAKLSSKCVDVWMQAKPKSNFKLVRPYLKKLVQLVRKESDLLGYGEHPYDALLDQHEPNAKLSVIKPLMIRVADKLSTLVPAITEKTSKYKVINGAFDEAGQIAMTSKVLKDIGYDFSRGRIDKVAHPFQSTIAFGDERLTTWCQKDTFLPCLYGGLHEGGHALYEQGYLKEHEGTPLGSYGSLGIHESQSRLWENLIGRSTEFCHYLAPIVSQHFPTAGLSTETLWQAANKVAPTLIRVEADEVTYSLHVVIRMLLEEALIAGDLEVPDLPGAWNELYRKYLGISPTTDREGVLQDIHWYQGAIGYFPTYVLGNLYASLFLKTAEKDIVDLRVGMREGRFLDLRNWLARKIHCEGRRYSAEALVQRVTGEPLHERAFLIISRRSSIS